MIKALISCLFTLSLGNAYIIQMIPSEQGEQQVPFLANHFNPLQSNQYATLVASAPPINDWRPDYLQTVYIPKSQRTNSGPQIESIHSSASFGSFTQPGVVTELTVRESDDVREDWEDENQQGVQLLNTFNKLFLCKLAGSVIVLAMVSGIIILIALLTRHHNH